MPSPPSRRWLSRIGEPHFLLPAIAVILLGVIWGTTANLIMVERAAANRSAGSSALELVDTYEAQVVRALREIDQALKLVAFAHERDGGRVDLVELKAKGLLPPDLLFIVRIADGNGAVTARTRSGEADEIAGRDYFRQAHARDAMVIGSPEWNAGEREWRLHFSRRLPSGPRGDAVVVMSVAAAYFVSGYEPARLGQHGVLGLLGTDGVFRARRTGEAVYSGDATNYRAAVPTTPAGPSAVAASQWDGVRRYIAARELFEFPLAVIVGLAETEQLLLVDEQARTYLWRAAAGSLVLVLLLGVLGRMSWNAAQFRRQAEAALNLRKRAIESSVNAILIIDHSKQGHPIEYVNPAFERITGYSAREAAGRDIGSLLGSDREQSGMQEIDRAVREQREGHAVLRNYRKDGSLFWNEFYIAPVRSESGVVTHYVGVMNDVTEAKTYEQQLAHQAHFDDLTGLANRNLLRDRLQQALASARRDAGGVVTIFLDVDNFKDVNDSLGHNVGDELLRRVGERLKGCVRESDTVARLGGDEFVIVLGSKRSASKALEADTTALADKLLAKVAEPVELGGRSIRASCSIGVSIYPQDGDDADTLLKNADAAMYRAKELGRNRFQFFTAEVHERIRRRMELESSLRLALERDEFELYYQPQVGIRSGMIVGAEALLRWRHPQKGLVGPAQFIGFAEETGLIVPIGEWVLRRACAQNKSWQEAGLVHIPVAVNMSARQCEQPDVESVVRRALADSGLAPEFLELEITESMSMADPEQSVPLLSRLKETGVTLSIDDFGTGFSNLGYLKRFPVDRLKIDLSFVREITSDPGSLAISEAIITMSHSLKLQVIAEGVETQGQLELLGARNCDMMQGYLFSPPLTAPAFATLLAEDRRLKVAPPTRTAAPSAVLN